MRVKTFFLWACLWACLFIDLKAQTPYDSLLNLDHPSLHDTVKLKVFGQLIRHPNIEIVEKYAWKT